MSVFASLDEVAEERPQVVTIGVFDGVHRGHQFLITQAVAAGKARAAAVTVITFWPPPILVLRPTVAPRCLMLVEEKLAALGQLQGVDHQIALAFTPELAAVRAADFMAELQTRLHVVALVEGDDFTLGHQREGTIDWLQAYGQGHGIDILPVERRMVQDAPISSTRIRALVEEGEVAFATELLGRPYQVSGEVVHGDARGRELGYPTANLAIDPLKLIPANGIYAVRAWRALSPSIIWDGAASVGVRPTFEGVDRRVEVYLLDVSPDLYGDILHVQFIERLREERRFTSIAALIAQMAEDVAETRRLLGTETGAQL